MLSDKIWITRKARIYAEQRLRSRALISQMLITYYSALLVGLSLWNLIYFDTVQVNLFLIFGSIAILVISVFLWSQKYTERSITMRNCYIKLDQIHSKVLRAEKNSDESAIEQLDDEYANTLLNVENHTDHDYLCLRYSLRNQKTTLPPFTKIDYLKYILERLWRNLGIILLFGLPFLSVIVWNLVKSYVSIDRV